MQNKNREAPFFYRKEEIEGEDRPLEASEATFQRHCSPGCVSVCLCVCVSVGVCVGRVRKSALTTTTTTTITTLVWRLWRLVDALNGHGGKNCGRRAVSFQTQDWSLGGGSRWRLLRRSLSLSLSLSLWKRLPAACSARACSGDAQSTPSAYRRRSATTKADTVATPPLSSAIISGTITATTTALITAAPVCLQPLEIRASSHFFLVGRTKKKRSAIATFAF